MMQLLTLWAPAGRRNLAQLGSDDTAPAPAAGLLMSCGWGVAGTQPCAAADAGAGGLPGSLPPPSRLTLVLLQA